MPKGPTSGKAKPDILFCWGKQGRDFELTNPGTELQESGYQTAIIGSLFG